MPHAFFWLSLPDTVSYAQADCDTLSGHCILPLPEGSLPTSAQGTLLLWQKWWYFGGLRMLTLLMATGNQHLQQIWNPYLKIRGRTQSEPDVK